MKTLFIPTKVKFELDKSKIKNISKKLPKNLAIAYSIQYKEIAEKIRDVLSENHNINYFIQVLGCSKPKFSKVQAVLLISSGKFHALSLAYETKLPIYILRKNKLEKISKKEIESLEKKKKSAYVRFLNSDRIGIIVSTKPGQENLKKALSFSKKIKDKENYLFLCNNINASEFENFSQIQSWVNTACPRLDMDSNIINLFSLNLSD